MKINAGTAGIKCEWKVELINANTGVVDRELPWQNNTILDTGMAYFVEHTKTSNAGLFKCNGLASAAPYYNSIAVGSGTNAPSFTDTALQTFIAAKAYDVAISPIPTYDGQNNTAPMPFTITASFSENEANGTIAEMGLLNGLTNTSGKYFSRNRLVDENGDPTTIVKDNAHLMKISARITVTRIGSYDTQYPITEVGGLGTANNVVSFVNNQWLAQSLLGDSGTGLYYTTTGLTAFASASAVSLSSGYANITYENMTGTVSAASIISTKTGSGKAGDDYYVDLKIEIPQAALNINIKSLFVVGFFRIRLDGATFGANSGMFCQFETPLPKDSSKKVYLTFRHTWTRS